MRSASQWTIGRSGPIAGLAAWCFPNGCRRLIGKKKAPRVALFCAPPCGCDIHCLAHCSPLPFLLAPIWGPSRITANSLEQCDVLRYNLRAVKAQGRAPSPYPLGLPTRCIAPSGGPRIPADLPDATMVVLLPPGRVPRRPRPAGGLAAQQRRPAACGAPAQRQDERRGLAEPSLGDVSRACLLLRALAPEVG